MWEQLGFRSYFAAEGPLTFVLLAYDCVGPLCRAAPQHVSSESNVRIGPFATFDTGGGKLSFVANALEPLGIVRADFEDVVLMVTFCASRDVTAEGCRAAILNR